MTPDIARRRHWMSVLAQAPTDTLLQLSEPAIADAEFELIRAPEIGLVQVRARAGGTGAAFNLGDMTLTRCVVRSHLGTTGHGQVAGRSKPHALRAAQLDALLQIPQFDAHLHQRVIEPLERQRQRARHAEQRDVETTRVDFFTLVRGED
ncbi:phosphonate C-P lyase system protein PhnG [Marichromatium gracile]|uniref:phosphonate C-P lyase system protein PhnG n=1 Tax=Marichromatium gracile TaxID=1048 RepID=UPI001F410753|nr:phosphonate C-P lyase system protein PhnG [Marichromatium gracile]MCF1182490.1 phosphonate C-P lyase system protein PhnG [Marichromatium gracile]